MLSQLAEVHKISVRDFAGIFGISKSHAEEILNHRKFPSLELAVRISRYWGCTVDDLFGWRVDDDGARRPLIVDVGDGQRIRVNSTHRYDDITVLIKDVAETFRDKRVSKTQGIGDEA